MRFDKYGIITASNVPRPKPEKPSGAPPDRQFAAFIMALFDADRPPRPRSPSPGRPKDMAVLVC